MPIKNPVESCYSLFDKLHKTVPKYFPCTYFTYRFGIIPHRTDFDLFTVISRIQEITFAFFLLKTLVACTHPILWALPALPLFIDLIWLLFQKIIFQEPSEKPVLT